MFRVGRKQAVGGDHRPVVVEYRGIRSANRDHWLDRQRDPFNQSDAATRPPVVEDVWWLVHLGSDPMPAVVVHDAVSERPDITLHRRRDIRELAPELRRRQTPPQRLLTGFGHVQDVARDRADRYRDRGVTMPAVHDRAAVDGDEISLTQYPLASWDGMHDLVVDGCADRRRKTLVSLEGWNGALSPNRALGDDIKISGTDTRFDGRTQLLQGARDDKPRHPHLRDLAFGLDLDMLSSRHARRPGPYP